MRQPLQPFQPLRISPFENWNTEPVISLNDGLPEAQYPPFRSPSRSPMGQALRFEQPNGSVRNRCAENPARKRQALPYPVHK